MTTLKVEKRDTAVKAKALRRQGLVPGSIYGRKLSENIQIQVNGAEAARFLKEHSRGSEVTLELDGQSIDTQLKEATYNPLKKQYDNIEFQALVAGEKVTGEAQIVLVHTDEAVGYLTHNLSEITYKALPVDLVEKIEIDVAKIAMDDKIFVSDLDIAKNDKIELITPADSLVLHMAEHQRGGSAEEAEDTEEETAAEE